MSTYLPVVFQNTADELRERQLILPLPSDVDYLSDVHREIEHELEVYALTIFKNLQMADGLQERWVKQVAAVSRFIAQTSEMFWAHVYGPDLVREIGILIFGRDLRLGLTQPETRKRRFGVCGVRGSARRPVGDAVRRLVLDGSLRASRREGVSGQTVLLRIGGDEGQIRLFGQAAQRLTDNSSLGLLHHDSPMSALFVDGLLSAGSLTKNRVLEYLDWDGQALQSQHLQPAWKTVHWVAGFRPNELGDNISPIAEAVFKRSCRDGLIELPKAVELLSTRQGWNRIFDLFFEQAVLDACGAPSQSIHQLSSLPITRAPFADDSPVDRERQGYVQWVNRADHRDAIKATVLPIFADYDWAGDLWEFESLVRRIVRARDSSSVATDKIRAVALDFRRHQPISGPQDIRASKWLSRFQAALSPLPLAEDTLPQVLSKVEMCYLTEAARVAAATRAPKPARIGDVAQLLGVPRQTASRKWQGYELSAQLLVDDQK